MKRVVITGLAVVFFVVAAMPALGIAQSAPPSSGGGEFSAAGKVPQQCTQRKKGKKKKRQNATHAAKCTYRRT